MDVADPSYEMARCFFVVVGCGVFAVVGLLTLRGQIKLIPQKQTSANRGPDSRSSSRPFSKL